MKADVIGICETKLPEYKRMPPLIGYASFQRCAEKGARGTAFYVKEELSPKLLDIEVTITTKPDRIIAVMVENNIFVEVYAPVNSDPEKKRKKFYESLIEYIR